MLEKKLKTLSDRFRATRRLAAFGGLVVAALAMVPVQHLVLSPLGNRTAMAKFLYNAFGWVFNIKVKQEGAPIEKGRPAWYVANHMSLTDALIGKMFNAVFVMNDDINKWPLVGKITEAAGYIGVRRSRKIREVVDGRQKTAEEIEAEKVIAEKHYRRNLGSIIKAFNKGQNIAMFPEGTTTPGDRVLRFSGGLLACLFNEAGIDRRGNEVRLEKDVVVQPLAIRVKSVNGRNVLFAKEEWGAYSVTYKNWLRQFWELAKCKELELEITAFKPIEPSSCKDHFELANKAHAVISHYLVPDADPAQAQAPGDYVRERKARIKAASDLLKAAA